MNPRQITAAALLQVERQGAYSNLTLEPFFARESPSPQDRAFASALFYGVLERQITLDWHLSHYSKTPIAKLDPLPRAALRLGALQLMFFPSVPPAAAVSQSVDLTRALGAPRAAGFVNGVLRQMARQGCAAPPPKDKLTALSVEYSVPSPLIQLWRKAYGHQNALQILQGSRGPAPVFVRVNTVHTTLPALRARLTQEGIPSQPVPGVPDALLLPDPGRIDAIPAFRDGLFHVQDISSQLCAAALDPRPGMDVLDLCAAPGGKTFTIAQRMANQGRILARDLHPHRLRLVEEGAARLGLTCIETAPGDAREFAPALAEGFHRVLCDVVCSGFGTLRRKPEIRYKPLESIAGLPELQYGILATAARYLKPGGRLVYSTCTLNPAENEAVVERFLAEHPDFAPAAPPRTYINGQDGLDCDGFFTAPLQRREEVSP